MLHRLLQDLERLLGTGKGQVGPPASPPAPIHTPTVPEPEAKRHSHTRTSRTMIHVRLDGKLTRAVRHALMAACGGQVDMMRFIPLNDSEQVRLSLCIQTPAVDAAMQTIRQHAPTAEFGRIVELPQTPSSTWLEVSLGGRNEAPAEQASSHAAESQRVQVNLFRHLLAPETVLLDLDVTDRAHALHEIAQAFAAYQGVESHAVADGLYRREKLGSTALGHGVAVPHARVNGLDQAGAVYVRTRMPIPFDAPDGNPVTDILALMVPEQANELHLQLLAKTAQIFSNKTFRKRLHECHEARKVCKLFAEYAEIES
jgi:PTS system nitrogen regulatory IIA component